MKLMTEPRVYAFANKNGTVICPFCKEQHQHGGNGNGTASGWRKPDCYECGDEEYFVIPFGKTIDDYQKNTIQNQTS